MAKKTIIDEDLVRQAIGNTPSILDADPPPFDERIIKTVEVPAETTQLGERRRVPLPDFEQTFLNVAEIRDRAAVYISGDTKRKILGVVRRIGSDRMTVTSYVENILRHHLETYREEINALYEARNSGKLL